MPHPAGVHLRTAAVVAAVALGVVQGCCLLHLGG